MREPVRVSLVEWEFALMPLSLVVVAAALFGLLWWLDSDPTNGQK